MTSCVSSKDCNTINAISKLINTKICTSSNPCGSNGQSLQCSISICNGLNSPCVAIWVGGNVIKAALEQSSTIIGNELFEYYTDNQPDFSISDDILWWGLARNLAFSYTKKKRNFNTWI